ncbi:hypothetical protein J1N35_022327 [Gossypium stocksii]|uniref:RNase H type-1 domain-containing protein n=1 Tax=Gossypium stocksii TaxID=47602 RepID=A0A9D4A115_9ROSI|nr:hypothetical protein J1N35_022327 [Gossypium stocksii]
MGKSLQAQQDFWIDNFSCRQILPRVLEIANGEKTQEGVAKMNVDASMKENRMGLDIILKDSDNFVLCGRVIFIDKVANLEWAKLDALFIGIQLTQSLNLDKVIFKMNCTYIVTCLCKHKDDITIFGYCIKEVYEMFNSFSKAEVK